MTERAPSISLVSSAVLGLSIGLGIALSGIFLGSAIRQARASQRHVSVRGLAEREVDADLVVWPIKFQEASNDLEDLYRKISEKRTIIANFLTEAGFRESEIEFSSPSIRDAQTQESDSRKASRFRYSADVTGILRSTDVARAKKTIERSGSLVGKGVALTTDYETRTQFLFNGLNKIKPAMIEEATRNAREAAEKFAKDSGSKLGKIQSATQGRFEISDRDQSSAAEESGESRTSSDKKLVRVVTQVDYFLVDE